MSVIGLIPARLASTRLPRKLLLDQTGHPLIQYVWEAACRSASLDRVIIAADSPEIAECAAKFGADCVLTGEHPSGTDRIAEVVRSLDPRPEIVVNLQGDEPELQPELIDTLVQQLRQTSDAAMATLGTPIRDLRTLEAASCVKLVRGLDGRALYFSRSPIPHVRDVAPESLLPDSTPWLLHLGLYAYRSDFLLKFASLPPSPLEQLEKLEQLRALEHGARIQVAVVEKHSVGIDTPEDYARFVERKRSATPPA